MGQSAGRLFAGGSCATPTCFNGGIDFCSDAQQQKGGVMVRRCGLEPPPPGQQPPLRSSKRVASKICADAIPLPWRWNAASRKIVGCMTSVHRPSSFCCRHDGCQRWCQIAGTVHSWRARRTLLQLPYTLQAKYRRAAHEKSTSTTIQAGLVQGGRICFQRSGWLHLPWVSAAAAAAAP